MEGEGVIEREGGREREREREMDGRRRSDREREGGGGGGENEKKEVGNPFSPVQCFLQPEYLYNTSCEFCKRKMQKCYSGPREVERQLVWMCNTIYRATSIFSNVSSRAALAKLLSTLITFSGKPTLRIHESSNLSRLAS